MQIKKEMRYVALLVGSFVLVALAIEVLRTMGSSLVGYNLRNLSEILFFFGGAVLLSLVPLFFLKEAIYKTWRKFAVVAIPLVLILIFVTPEYDRSIYGITREYVTFLVSGAFLAISYLIILIQYFRTPK